MNSSARSIAVANDDSTRDALPTYVAFSRFKRIERLRTVAGTACPPINRRIVVTFVAFAGTTSKTRHRRRRRRRTGSEDGDEEEGSTSFSTTDSIVTVCCLRIFPRIRASSRPRRGSLMMKTSACRIHEESIAITESTESAPNSRPPYVYHLRAREPHISGVGVQAAIAFSLIFMTLCCT